MSNKQHIDDFFKDELEDYVETPPPAAWDAFEKRLDTRKPIRPGISKRMFWYFAGVALMVSLGLSVRRYVSENRQSDTNNFIAATNSSNTNTQADNNSNSDNINSNNTSTSGNTSTSTASHKETNNPSHENGNTNNGIASAADQSNGNRKNSTGDQNEDADRNNGTAAALHSSAGSAHNASGKRSKTTNGAHIASINKKNKSKTAGHNRSKKNSAAADDDQRLVYNSNVSLGDAAPVSADPEPSTPPPALPPSPNPTQKPENKADSLPPLAENKKEEPKKNKQHIQRFELGFKAGYESGFNNDAARKAVASPYMQYNISKKFAIMMQPSAKGARLDSRRIGGSQTYYKVNGDGKTKLIDSSMILLVTNDGSLDSMWLRQYSYSQSHDSIIKTNFIGGNYVEFDVPLLLKYAITKNLSVYGGLDITYGRLISIDEHTYTSDPLVKTAKQPTIGHYDAPAPTPVPIEQLITYKGTPISAYTGQQYPSPKGNLLRYGYMLGISYEYSKRWMVDGMLLQNTVQPDVRAGYNINAALSAAYFRFTLGYKITRPGK